MLEDSLPPRLLVNLLRHCVSVREARDLCYRIQAPGRRIFGHRRLRAVVAECISIGTTKGASSTFVHNGSEIDR